MMGIHKLTAGDGYLYLVRQVAASDATAKGRTTLSDYYSSKGESPGVWTGRGLAALGAPRGDSTTSRQRTSRCLRGHRNACPSCHAGSKRRRRRFNRCGRYRKARRSPRIRCAACSGWGCTPTRWH